MKIYNEVTSIFNEITGKWKTISEDSFEWNGSVMQLQNSATIGSVSTFSLLTPLETTSTTNEAGDSVGGGDKVQDTLKITAGYFTNGDGTLEGKNTYTGSLADSNEKYYYNIIQTHPSSASVATQFSVAYGHIAGSGSDTRGGTANAATLKGETEAIYEQFTSLLLTSNEISGGFQISQQGTNGV